MWRLDQRGNREFAFGKEAWDVAAELAGACASFVADVEEEQVVDEELSCYNCRYRRWSVESFTCLGLSRQFSYGKEMMVAAAKDALGAPPLSISVRRG